MNKIPFGAEIDDKLKLRMILGLVDTRGEVTITCDSASVARNLRRYLYRLREQIPKADNLAAMNFIIKVNGRQLKIVKRPLDAAIDDILEPQNAISTDEGRIP